MRELYVMRETTEWLAIARETPDDISSGVFRVSLDSIVPTTGKGNTPSFLDSFMWECNMPLNNT